MSTTPSGERVPISVIRLEAIVEGIVVGLVVGGGVFAATNLLVLRGGRVVGPHLALLSQFFVGYEVSFLGSLVGFAWGFVYGFLAGYFVATLYNLVVVRRAK